MLLTLTIHYQLSTIHFFRLPLSLFPLRGIPPCPLPLFSCSCLRVPLAPCPLPLSCHGIVQRLMQIQLAHRIAILIRLGALDAFPALAGSDFLMPLALAFTQIRENF